MADELKRKDGLQIMDRQTLAGELHHAAVSSGTGFAPPTWTGHWRDWYLMRADEIIASRAVAVPRFEDKK